MDGLGDQTGEKGSKVPPLKVAPTDIPRGIHPDGEVHEVVDPIHAEGLGEAADVRRREDGGHRTWRFQGTTAHESRFVR